MLGQERRKQETVLDSVVYWAVLSAPLKVAPSIIRVVEFSFN